MDTEVQIGDTWVVADTDNYPFVREDYNIVAKIIAIKKNFFGKYRYLASTALIPRKWYTRKQLLLKMKPRGTDNA